MKKTERHPESAEESLAVLIKEAGEEARKRKKKAMKEHAIKLRDAIHGKLADVRQTESL